MLCILLLLLCQGQTSEMEWDDDAMNSGDMTSSSEETSASSTESEHAEDEPKVHQTNSVMTSLASSADRGNIMTRLFV